MPPPFGAMLGLSSSPLRDAQPQRPVYTNTHPASGDATICRLTWENDTFDRFRGHVNDFLTMTTIYRIKQELDGQQNPY
jgi:hypothetical protein